MNVSASGRFSKVYGYLASTELTVLLFLFIAVVAIPGTLTERSAFYSSPMFIALLVAFGCHLSLCTLRRFRSISRPVLMVHVGVLITLLGAVVKTFGFTATVNAYENDTVTEFYRWDLEKDVDLGFRVIVKKINREFYPTPIKVGVRKQGAKESLHLLKTGESFFLGEFRVSADELAANGLGLTVYQGGRRTGSYRTATRESDLPAGFPYTFELVAYQNPRLKKEWLDLAILQDGRVVATGTSGVNSPMVWNHVSLFNPDNDIDQNGIAYAGIQAVRDPGMPIVFTGLALIGGGVVFSSWRRLTCS